MPFPPLAHLTRWARPPHRLRRVYERVLGTELEVQILADTQAEAEVAEDAALGEIERLSAVLNQFDPTSEFSRWTRRPGEATALSTELREVLSAADHWRVRTGGAFHPGADALGALWRRAQESGQEPGAQDLRRLALALCDPPWTLRPDGRVTLQATYPLGLNALAKGYIVDRATQAAIACSGVRAVLVNVGGDLRTCGGDGLTVAVADPFTLRDNAPPVAQVKVRNAALATSGNAHRGYRVGDVWHSHVLNPRTGRPVTRAPGVTVTAPDCMTADALATVLSVLPVSEGLALVDGTPGTAALIVSARGARHTSRRWGRSPPA